MGVDVYLHVNGRVSLNEHRPEKIAVSWLFPRFRQTAMLLVSLPHAMVKSNFLEMFEMLLNVLYQHCHVNNDNLVKY